MKTQEHLWSNCPCGCGNTIALDFDGATPMDIADGLVELAPHVLRTAARLARLARFVRHASSAVVAELHHDLAASRAGAS